MNLTGPQRAAFETGVQAERKRIADKLRLAIWNLGIGDSLDMPQIEGAIYVLEKLVADIDPQPERN